MVIDEEEYQKEMAAARKRGGTAAFHVAKKYGREKRYEVDTMSEEKTPYDKVMDAIGALLAGQKSSIEVMKSIESRLSAAEDRLNRLEKKCYRKPEGENLPGVN